MRDTQKNKFLGRRLSTDEQGKGIFLDFALKSKNTSGKDWALEVICLPMQGLPRWH